MCSPEVHQPACRTQGTLPTAKCRSFSNSCRALHHISRPSCPAAPQSLPFWMRSVKWSMQNREAGSLLCIWSPDGTFQTASWKPLQEERGWKEQGSNCTRAWGWGTEAKLFEQQCWFSIFWHCSFISGRRKQLSMCLFDVGFILKLCCPTLKKSHLDNKGRDEDATACSNHCLISPISFSLAAAGFPPEKLWGPALLVVASVRGGIGLVKYPWILLHPKSWRTMRQWLGTLYVNHKQTTYCYHLQSPSKCFCSEILTRSLTCASVLLHCSMQEKGKCDKDIFYLTKNVCFLS